MNYVLKAERLVVVTAAAAITKDCEHFLMRVEG